MEGINQFTEGKITGPLIKFALPVLLAMCLQSLYGAVDLLVVGQFGTAADVSAVATGSQIMSMVMVMITGLAMGTTVLLGQAVGGGRKEETGNIIGSSICFFSILAIGIMVLMMFAAKPCAVWMRTPKEAFDTAVEYVKICSGGILFIVAYNMLGSIFRGIGDSKTPLMTVFFACVFNIAGDLLFVAGLQMQAAGASLATVLAQGFSVVLCLVFVRKRELPFQVSRENLKFDKEMIGRIVKVGFPIALQDGLVCMSFLVINAIVNGLGVVASAGVGVAEKVCGFVMLVPSAFSQSLSAFVAQNIGAGKRKRARKSMACGMGASFLVGIVMAYIAFFHGDILSGVFAGQKEVVLASADYLKSYAIDTLMVSFLFCYIGYYNGCGKTNFVMIQGIVGAFFVRIPVSYLMSQTENPTLFKIGLATPASTVVQIMMCTAVLIYMIKKEKAVEN